jgi:hypothetical protein
LISGSRDLKRSEQLLPEHLGQPFPALRLSSVAHALHVVFALAKLSQVFSQHGHFIVHVNFKISKNAYAS